MKSIKEKAKEYSLEPRANAHCGYDEEDLENSFEAGADYAIAKALEWLKNFCNEHYIMSYADSSEVETEELIDIFKKKMEE